jgi:death-on-curing protein
MIHLTFDEMMRVARRAIDADVLVRDAGLLESAIVRPRTSIMGSDAYPTLDLKAAALVHSLVTNHALVDGDKRLGLAGLITFLGVNGRRLTMTEDAAYDFIVEIADGRLDDVETIARCIAALCAARRSGREL